MIFDFQIVINIAITASIYIVSAYSFYVLYSAYKYLDFFHAISYVIPSYIIYCFLDFFKFPIGYSIILGLLTSLPILVFFRYYLFLLFQKFQIKSPLAFLLLSLGLYITFQNLISLVFGDATLSIRSLNVSKGNEFFNAYITNNQILIIISGIVLFLFILLYIKNSRIGLRIEALETNEALAKILGININRIKIYSLAIATAIAGISGLLFSIERDINPQMGFNLFLYGVIVMIIGGVKNVWGLIYGSLLLAAAQHLGSYYLNSKWTEAIAYLILVLFLIWKPLGFSGKKLKKIEI